MVFRGQKGKLLKSRFRAENAVKARFPNVVGPATDICYATQNRQAAVRNLAKNVDVVLVIGAHNSSNSTRLRERATEEAGIPSYLIEDASHLDPARG